MYRQVVSDVAGELHQLLAAKRDLAREASSAPVTLAELGVLRSIETHGPCGLGPLAAETGVDTSVVSRQVSALVATGLVERTVDPRDGRSHPVRITPAGRTALERSRAAVLARWEQALSGWGDDDLDHLAAGLRRLRHDLRPAAGPHGGRRCHPRRRHHHPHPVRPDASRQEHQHRMTTVSQRSTEDGGSAPAPDARRLTRPRHEPPPGARGPVRPPARPAHHDPVHHRGRHRAAGHRRPTSAAASPRTPGSSRPRCWR